MRLTIKSQCNINLSLQFAWVSCNTIYNGTFKHIQKEIYNCFMQSSRAPPFQNKACRKYNAKSYQDDLGHVTLTPIISSGLKPFSMKSISFTVNLWIIHFFSTSCKLKCISLRHCEKYMGPCSFNAINRFLQPWKWSKLEFSGSKAKYILLGFLFFLLLLPQCIFYLLYK